MKLLKDILFGCRITEISGSTHIAIAGITADSRKVVRDGIFVAIKGTLTDGHDYIEAAISKGARAIICEDLPEHQGTPSVTFVGVRDAQVALGVTAANFYDNPSTGMKVIAVTGTNGKTTVASTLHALFLALDKKAGLLSTIVNKINKELVPATHTTPDPVAAQKLLRKMADAGCKYVFMEASSHGIVQGRLAGIEISGAVFTNISHDHLDYHKTFDNYIKAKKKLFDDLSPQAFALVNIDDRHGDTMLQNCAARHRTFSLRTIADYKGRILESQLNGQLLKINETEVWTRFIGKFNAYNLTAVFGVARELRIEPMQIMTAISLLEPVEGRFQHFRSKNGITGIVDYAHTPDALQNVLDTISQIRTRNEKVITIVGCGGDRDKEKRPEMAKIAANLSDQVILTSDNPRSEDPEQILLEMMQGVEIHQRRKAIKITNRAEAIAAAVAMAQTGDIILIAGKGHENYQEIQGVKHPFNDMEVLRHNLEKSES
jgi:UDP-N-acetylmuramoyl-L-alanyl-D-glutamate--2,6-diaminopimelate ligase